MFNKHWKTGKRALVVFVTIILVASILSGLFAYRYGLEVARAQSASLTSQTLSGGITQVPSYTVWTEGGYYYAKDAYGAIPSWGSSANASYIIQYSMNSLTNGGEVFIKTGTYTLTNSLIIPYDGVTLMGEGRTSTVLRGNSADIITCTGKSFVVIENLELNGIDSSHNGIIVHGTYGSVANDYCSFNNLLLVNFNNAMELDTWRDGQMNNIFIENCNYGITFENGVMNSFLNGLHIKSIVDNAFTITKSTQRSEGISVTNSIFQANGIHLLINDGLDVHFTDVLFDTSTTNNVVLVYGGDMITFDGCYFSGYNTNTRTMVVPQANPLNGVYFTECHFASNGYFGLLISNTGGSRPTNIFITNCLFENNGVGGSGGDLTIADADKVSVTDSQLNSTVAPYNLVESGSPTSISLTRTTIAKGASGLGLIAGATTFLSNINFVTENTGSANNATATTFSISHGLSEIPTEVWASFSTPNINGWYWSSSSSTLTITVTGSSLPSSMVCYWKAEYHY